MPPRRAAPKKTGKAPRKATTANRNGENTQEEHAPDSSPLPPLPPSDDELPAPIANAKKRKAPPPRSPLPKRDNRVKNPGAPDQPRSKRTHAEVEADKQEIATLKADIARLHQERLEALARMEVAEDTNAEAAAESTVMFKSLMGGKKNKPIVGSTFGRREQEQELDPHDGDNPFLEFEDEDFDAAAEADERIRRALKAEKRVRAMEADRYNLDKLPPIPLAPAKVSKGRQKGAGRVAIEQAKDKLSHKRDLSGDDSEPDLEVKKAAGVAIGGLGEDDLDDVWPMGTGRSKNVYHRDSVRQRGRDSNQTSARPVHKRKDVQIKKEIKPQLSSAAAKVKVKVEASMAVDSEVAGLPEFVRNSWCTRFLPTWYHYIGTRKSGWDICELGDEVRVVQLVLDVVHPGSGYRVRKGCPIFVTAMARLSDKRHLIGVQTAKLVDAFFSTVEYADKPKKIAKYANYAIEDNGPAWYEEPAPRGLVHGVPGYTTPTGLFRSEFCLVPLSAFIKSTAKSKGEFGNRFVHAAAMICAGLERAFNQYITGVKVLNGKFSKGRVGEYVVAFTKSACRLEDWRWTKIMKCCISLMQADNGHLISASAAMNVDRGAMILGSSPVKGSDDDEM
ncbi:hypothetical protein B0H13DRAFT_1915718 [Mycena leptocephala]|nr:hypothetical protein B0H13DRAFT_1915718 [Mycena leptocephala]